MYNEYKLYVKDGYKVYEALLDEHIKLSKHQKHYQFIDNWVNLIEFNDEDLRARSPASFWIPQLPLSLNKDFFRLTVVKEMME